MTPIYTIIGKQTDKISVEKPICYALKLDEQAVQQI